MPKGVYKRPKKKVKILQRPGRQKNPRAPKDKPEPNPVGRPSTYSKEMAMRICEVIATTNKGLPTICEDYKNFPGTTTIYRWLAHNEEFRSMYALAKKDQETVIFESLLAIADTPQLGQVITIKADGTKEIKAQDMVEHRRLRLGERHWILARLNPRRWGNKLQLEGDTDTLTDVLDEMKKQYNEMKGLQNGSAEPQSQTDGGNTP